MSPRKAAAAKVPDPAVTAAEVIARSTEGVQPVSHDLHPGNARSRHGHVADEEVKQVAHFYEAWATGRANGSGLVAVAAWARRLEREGKTAATDGAEGAATFLRGLTHR